MLAIPGRARRIARPGPERHDDGMTPLLRTDRRHGRWRTRAPKAFDVVTPTAHEALTADIAGRRRRYFLVIGPCIALVLVGFFVPLPIPVRIVILLVAALLAPAAAIVANARGRR